VVVSHLDQDRVTQSSEKHYFLGYEVFGAQMVSPTTYVWWQVNREYRTDLMDGNSQVLRRIDYSWQQRASVGWYSPGAYFSQEPPNDPRVVETDTTLMDVGLIEKRAFGYDSFNNLTDTWEFDYGIGSSPSYPLRHSHTDFLMTNPANGIDYAGQTVHLIGLPKARFLYSVNPSNGIETVVAYTAMNYDEPAYPT